MKQRVNLVTLGVTDLERSRAFYTESAGSRRASPTARSIFFQAGEMVVALWDRERLAEDSAVENSAGVGRGDARRQPRDARPRSTR